MTTNVNSIRDTSSDKKPFWKTTAKRVVLFVIGVSIVLQFGVYVNKWFTDPYGYTEFTQIVATGSERLVVGTVVEKPEDSNASLRTAVTVRNGNHRTGSKEGVLSNGISKPTDVLKPVFTITTLVQPAGTLEANTARETVFLRTDPLREATSIVGNFQKWQVPSTVSVGNEGLSKDSLFNSKTFSAHPILPIVSSQALKKTSSNERYYKILIYGTKKRLSQRLDFLIKNNGTWRKDISCGVNVTIDLHVGNATDDFEGQNAVVFNMDEIMVAKYVGKMPMQTSPNLAWIYYGREPAVRLRWLFRSCGHLPLHGIWSYQHDSEVLMNYGSFVQTKPMTSRKQSASFWSSGKDKLVAWMARNCNKTFWPRSKFVKSLKKHISVDIYGTCGDLACPFVPSLQECRNKLSKYKFYLALENAECEDYITEKMWETALAHGIVPVVYGAPKATYLKQAPPNSYIYIGDFNSTKALAEYLKMLDKKPKLYAKYFEWRYKGHIELPKRSGEPLPPKLFCSLIPFISKVEKGDVKRKTLSEFPFYKSCKRLKGKEVGIDYQPTLADRAKRWKLNW